jgi:hypothetical protein
VQVISRTLEVALPRKGRSPPASMQLDAFLAIMHAAAQPYLAQHTAAFARHLACYVQCALSVDAWDKAVLEAAQSAGFADGTEAIMEPATHAALSSAAHSQLPETANGSSACRLIAAPTASDVRSKRRQCASSSAESRPAPVERVPASARPASSPGACPWRSDHDRGRTAALHSLDGSKARIAAGARGADAAQERRLARDDSVTTSQLADSNAETESDQGCHDTDCQSVES